MLIGVTGAARHGKDSIANLLVEKFGFTKLGFADAVREMAVAVDPYVNCGANRHFTEGDTPFARYSDVLRSVGYETAKSYGDVRRLLQRIGTEAGRNVLGDSVWVDAVENKLRKLGILTANVQTSDAPNVVINDVRFENEADMVHRFGGYLIRVTRPNFDNGLPATHASESAIATLDVDYEIEAEAFDDLLIKAEVAYAHFLTDSMDTTVYPAEPIKPVVYLAAPWVHKTDAAEAKQRLQLAGIEVVSGWTERENTPQEVEPTIMAEQAKLDHDEVRAANTLVILGLAKSEGKASEMGMALYGGKRVILVKEDRVGNIFYHLPEVERVDTLEDAITLLLGGQNYRANTTPFAATIHSVTDVVTPSPLGVITMVADGQVAKASLPSEDFEFGTILKSDLNETRHPSDEPVVDAGSDDTFEHDLARHAGESGKD